MCQPLAETDLIITGGPESLAPPAHGKENANPAALVVPTKGAATGGRGFPTGGGARGQQKPKAPSSIAAVLAKERAQQEASNAAQLARIEGAGTKNRPQRGAPTRCARRGASLLTWTLLRPRFSVHSLKRNSNTQGGRCARR